MPKGDSKARKGAISQVPPEELEARSVLVTAADVITPPGMTPPTPEGIALVDPFDPGRFAVQQTALVKGVKRIYTNLRCGYSLDNKSWWRAHPTLVQTGLALLTANDSKKSIFLCEPALIHAYPKHIISSQAWLMVDTHKTPYLWLAKEEQPNGTDNAWWEQKRQIQVEAITKWTQVHSSGSEYVAEEPEDDLGKPEFPDWTMSQVLKLAFDKRVITDSAHPVLGELIGRKPVKA